MNMKMRRKGRGGRMGEGSEGGENTCERVRRQDRNDGVLRCSTYK